MTEHQEIAMLQEAYEQERRETLDDKGLPVWVQAPFLTADGEMTWGWELRKDVKLDGYARNYIRHAAAAAKNQILRDRWREEALGRWSAAEFDTEVERLREERGQEGLAAVWDCHPDMTVEEACRELQRQTYQTIENLDQEPRKE